VRSGNDNFQSHHAGQGAGPRQRRSAGPGDARVSAAPLRADAEIAEAADKMAALLKSIARPGRLLILCVLRDGPRSVGELARAVGVREPAMSQQLAKLKADGFVDAIRHGRIVHYAISRAGIVELIHFLLARIHHLRPDGLDPAAETDPG